MSVSTIGAVWSESMRALSLSARAIGNVAEVAERASNIAVLRATIYETRESKSLQDELDNLLQD